MIKPNNKQQTQAEPIKIQPRKPETANIASNAPTEEASAPIRIGKASSSVTVAKASTSAPDFAKKNATEAAVDASSAASPVHPTPEQPTEKKATAVSSVKPAVKKALTEKKATPKKKIRTIHQTPVTPLPEEDSYDEVLDEPISEEEVQPEEIPYEEPEVVSADPKLSDRAMERQKQLRRLRDNPSVPIYELIRRKTGLDEGDISMIFELGYDNELGRLVGYENLKKLKSEHLRRISKGDRKHYRTAFGYRGEEYTGQNSDTVKAAYVRDKKTMILRILLTALLSVFLLALDFPEWIGGVLVRLSLLSPYLFPGISLAGLIGVLLLSLRQLNAGLRSFFKFASTPYSVLSMLTPVLLGYNLLLLLFPDAGMLKVNFIASVFFLLAAIADAFRLVGEMRSLAILSSPEIKTVLAPAATRKKKLRYGDRIVKIINDDAGEDLYRVQQAQDTTGFFRRFNSMDAAVLPFSLLIPLAGAVAFLAGIGYAVFVDASFPSAVSVAMTVLMVGVPINAIFCFFYPLCRANTVLAKRKCTLVGEEAVEALCHPKTVIFDDSDMYTAEKCNEISVRQGDDFKEDLHLAGILFRKIGSTLNGIGKTAPKSREKDPPVTIVRITDYGIEAVINNSEHILAGSAEFLEKNGVRVSKESADKALRRRPNVSILYVAINSVLKLSYDLEYRTYRSFEEMASLLAQHNTAIAIHSYDPDLNDIFLQNSRVDTAETIRVIKPGRFEYPSVLEVTDTNAVSLGKKTDIAYPIYAAQRVKQARRDSTVFQFIISLGGAALAATLLFTGQSSLLTLFTIVGFHLCQFLLSLIGMHLQLNSSTFHFKKRSR